MHDVIGNCVRPGNDDRRISCYWPFEPVFD